MSCIEYAARPRRPEQCHPEYNWLVDDRVQLNIKKDRFSWGGGVKRVNVVLADGARCLKGLGVNFRYGMFVPELLC